MPIIIIDEDEVEALTDQISDLCNGKQAALILAAMTDMLAQIAEAHPGLSMNAVMEDFVGLALQRHGANGSQSAH